MSNKLENLLSESFYNPEEITFSNGESKVIFNAKTFVDLNKNIEDLKTNLKYCEQLRNRKNDVLLSLKKDKYKEIVDLEYRMKLTSEISFTLFKN